MPATSTPQPHRRHRLRAHAHPIRLVHLRRLAYGNQTLGLPFCPSFSGASLCHETSRSVVGATVAPQQQRPSHIIAVPGGRCQRISDHGGVAARRRASSLDLPAPPVTNRSYHSGSTDAGEHCLSRSQPPPGLRAWMRLSFRSKTSNMAVQSSSTRYSTNVSAVIVALMR